MKAVYGLCDGPLQFFRSLIEISIELGMKQSALDPCLFYFRNPDGVLAGFIGTEVDDLLIAGAKFFHDTVIKALKQKLVFGKWTTARSTEGVRFCGRRLLQLADYSMEVDQTFYSNSLQLPKMERDRRKDVDAELTASEVSQYRAGIGALNWLQTQTRPDLSGKANIIQGAFPAPKVKDFLQLLAAMTEAKDTSD